MILVKLPGIKGDSELEGFKDWLTVDSFSFEATREFKESGKAGTKDVVMGMGELGEVSLGKSMDISSLYLFQQAVAGTSLGTVEVAFVETAGTDAKKPEPYLKYKLDDTFIKQWSIDGSEDERPSESLQLWYRKICMTWRSTEDGKTFKDHGPVGWDRVKNQNWAGT